MGTIPRKKSPSHSGPLELCRSARAKQNVGPEVVVWEVCLKGVPRRVTGL